MPLGGRIVMASSIVFGVAGFWFGLSRVGAPAVGSSGPQAEQASDAKPTDSGFEPALIDLGKVPWGTTTTVSITLWNRGEKNLPIAKIKSSCSCVVVADVASLEGTTVPRGESREFEVQVDFGRKPGPVERDVWVDTHQGRSYWTKIRYDVRPGWVLVPANVDFGGVLITSDDAIRKTVKYRSREAQITRLEPTENWFRVQRGPAADNRPGEDLTVEVTPSDVAPGRHVAALRVFTTDPAVPEDKLVVTIEGITDLVPYPPES